jgi:hypothetical protein
MQTTKIVHHSIFNGYIIDPQPTMDINELKLISKKEFEFLHGNVWIHQNIGNKNFIPQRFKNGDFIIHFVGGSIIEKVGYMNIYQKQIIR